ncbi:hypothetical protein Scep_004377 [Stephania cephalantha]|uniref:Uncharacterized protein n=1 Tax=Stephania cephalantha TaxID=152367 RepID=A0AAP0KTT2_9MAGN
MIMQMLDFDSSKPRSFVRCYQMEDFFPFLVPNNVKGITKESSNCWFYNLKTIKINFQGMKTEMRLVKFLLRASVSLELLVLVVAPKYGLQMQEIETRK